MQPCLCILHRKVQTGLHRFSVVRKIDVHFGELNQLLNMHSEYVAFLTDKGANVPPAKYLYAVENGLRSFGKDVAAMGKFAMTSKQEWLAVEKWRKRECYIEYVRRKLVMGNYNKYIAYKWDDYIMRKATTTTYEIRHAQYHDGTKDLDGLPDPPEWSTDPNPRKRKRSPTTKQPAVQCTTEPASIQSPASGSGGPETMWDSENEEWVEL